MTKIEINDENWVKIPGDQYDYSFKANFEILINIKGVYLKDEEHSSIQKAIESINTTLSPYYKKAIVNLENYKKEEEKQ